MTESADVIFGRYQDRQVTYKGSASGYIAGWQGNYVILGFPNDRGCITEFNKFVIVNRAREGCGGRFDFMYKSFRFAKPKNIELL